MSVRQVSRSSGRIGRTCNDPAHAENSRPRIIAVSVCMASFYRPIGSCSSSVLQVVAWFLVWDRTSGQVVPKQCADALGRYECLRLSNPCYGKISTDEQEPSYTKKVHPSVNRSRHQRLRDYDEALLFKHRRKRSAMRGPRLLKLGVQSLHPHGLRPGRRVVYASRTPSRTTRPDSLHRG